MKVFLSAIVDWIIWSFIFGTLLLWIYSSHFHEEPYVEHHEDTYVVMTDNGPVVMKVERSSQWTKVRNAYLSKHRRCAACGRTDNLNVHHIKPFHLYPELELDEKNFITLCIDHHFHLGHRCNSGGSNWARCFNPNVREDAAKEYKKNVSKL